MDNEEDFSLFEVLIGFLALAMLLLLGLLYSPVYS